MSVLSFVFIVFSGLIQPKISWTSATAHDFGTILRGQPVNHIFYFKNVSSQPITVDNVRTDCGCTSPDFDSTPIASGELGKISIVYDAAQSGYFKKKITVWLHGQKKAEKLWIEGDVEE